MGGFEPVVRARTARCRRADDDLLDGVPGYGPDEVLKSPIGRAGHPGEERPAGTDG
ncbi:hypothetical protein ABZ297_18955 [Nonomuraea sp. NPDC005983]|uniref:hypothetical protein n=1 Tax=Nonomuraea sp. NPDC005983 TaxID=3155595 RepID=UPI0033BCED60